MNTLKTTLPNGVEIEWEVPQSILDYNKVSLDDTRLNITNTGIDLRNRNNTPIFILIKVDSRPFAACCGLNVWENLFVDSRVSKELFNSWIEWNLSTFFVPTICVLVRLCDKNGPNEYTLPYFQLFANYGQLIAQYRNFVNHPDHILEIMALMPPNYSKEILQLHT